MVVSKYLSTGPSPEFRSLPPLPLLPLVEKLFHHTDNGRVPRVRSLHTTAAQAGQDVWRWRYVFLLFLFFSFFLFLFFFPFFLCGHGMGSLTSLARWQPIDGQSTHRPSFNCASSTKPVKTSHRHHPRPLLPPSTINSHPPTHMHNNTSRPAPWTLPCSPQPASAQVHSCRTRITLCSPVSPSPTMTQSCTG